MAGSKTLEHLCSSVAAGAMSASFLRMLILYTLATHRDLLIQRNDTHALLMWRLSIHTPQSEFDPIYDVVLCVLLKAIAFVITHFYQVPFMKYIIVMLLFIHTMCSVILTFGQTKLLPE